MTVGQDGVGVRLKEIKGGAEKRRKEYGGARRCRNFLEAFSDQTEWIIKAFS